MKKLNPPFGNIASDSIPSQPDCLYSHLGVFFMKEIQLTQGKFALVDDEDYDYLISLKWSTRNHSGNSYACYSYVSKGKRNSFPMHRLIMGVINKTVIIDHIDHNGLNNQKSNLRICSRQQNSCNRSLTKNSFSKYKGVTFRRNRWHSRICINRKNIPLGYFKNEIDAAKSYDKGAKKYHGEFANLNFPNR